jgi:hypothetical protein
MLQTLEVSHQSLSGWGRHGAVTKPAFLWPRVRPTPAGQPKPSHALLLSTSPRSWASALRFSSASPSKTVLLVATYLVLALVFCPLSQTTTKPAFTGLQERARVVVGSAQNQSSAHKREMRSVANERQTWALKPLAPRERERRSEEAPFHGDRTATARSHYASTVTAQLPRGTSSDRGTWHY